MQTHQLITPNEPISRDLAKMVVLGWLGVWFGSWFLFRPVIFPSPLDVLQAIPTLWNEDGLGPELFASLRVNVEALIISIFITFPLAYLSRVPLIRPVAQGAAKLRFLSPAAFFVPLLFMTGSGHQLKVAMLVTGEAFFLLTTMLGVVADIPNDQFDDARTLRMDEWTATYYVVISGTLPQAFSAIRDSGAMGWGMLMMVEGIVRSEGGVGVMLIDANKYRDFAAVYALSLVVLAIGWLQDFGIGYTRNLACPYAALKVSR